MGKQLRSPKGTSTGGQWVSTPKPDDVPQKGLLLGGSMAGDEPIAVIEGFEGASSCVQLVSIGRGDIWKPLYPLGLSPMGIKMGMSSDDPTKFISDHLPQVISMHMVSDMLNEKEINEYHAGYLLSRLERGHEYVSLRNQIDSKLSDKGKEVLDHMVSLRAWEEIQRLSKRRKLRYIPLFMGTAYERTKHSIFINGLERVTAVKSDLTRIPVRLRTLLVQEAESIGTCQPSHVLERLNLGSGEPEDTELIARLYERGSELFNDKSAGALLPKMSTNPWHGHFSAPFAWSQYELVDGDLRSMRRWFKTHPPTPRDGQTTTKDKLRKSYEAIALEAIKDLPSQVIGVRLLGEMHRARPSKKKYLVDRILHALQKTESISFKTYQQGVVVARPVDGMFESCPDLKPVFEEAFHQWDKIKESVSLNRRKQQARSPKNT